MQSVRVLVALEDQREREQTVAALRAANIPPVADTGDGQVAYELSRHLTPDLLILDAHLRVAKGERVVDKVRSTSDISLVLLSEPKGLSVLCEMARVEASACLLRPVQPEQIVLTALFAARQRAEIQALRKRAETAERRLADRKLVDRAKAALMEELQISEAEAYRHLRRLSMNSRKSLGEVAEMVLLDRSLRS